MTIESLRQEVLSRRHPAPPAAPADILREVQILLFGTMDEKADQRKRYGLSDAEFWEQIRADIEDALKGQS
jgi:hypothetical protein